MPTRPENPQDLNKILLDMRREIRELQRVRFQLPEDSDALQTFENGSPLGDTRFLNFGAGINASLVGDDYVLVEGSGGGGCAGATVTVAAFDSHQAALDCADFVCTGVNDEVTLNAARAECVLRSTTPSGTILNGKVLLFQGTYLLKAAWSNNAQPVQFQGFGLGTIVRAVSGFTDSRVVLMNSATGAGNTGYTETLDMWIDAAGLCDYALDLQGPFSPSPTAFRHHVRNVRATSGTNTCVRNVNNVATFLFNVETSGGQTGIDTSSGSNPGWVIGCRVDGSTSFGIISSNRITNCVITNCDTGILMAGNASGTNSEVSSCFITGGDIGITIGSVEGTCVGNHITVVGEYGIRILTSGAGNVISSNRIHLAGGDGTFAGIRVEGDENLIIGNKVRSSTGFGLQFIAGGDNNIDAFNDLRNNTGGTYTDAGTGNLHYPTTSGTGMAPSNADYLVGTANADLSAEIVVGTTPGGELGGTWAAPTVDTVHSGSAHTDSLLAWIGL